MRSGRAATGGLAVVAAVFALGCAAREARVARYTDEYHGVIVSNSPMMLERPEPSLEGGRLVFVYSLLLENVGDDRVTAGFAYANAKVVDAAGAGTAVCRAGTTRLGVLDLHAGDRWRVDCRVTLPAQVTETVRRADTTVSLSIPLRSPIGHAELKVTYLLRVEDVS